MPTPTALLTDAATLAGATGLAYTTAVLTVALASVLFRTPARRRDARATLALLLRRTQR
ncbi:hypothetical protein ACFXAF_12580 [Kitasatospora sp. NPDC059463]|uniref:hypothetical protein n=1 Tax=unclassified Kitasatospora TaxID=2633591 RepID=UPI00369DCF97